MSTFQEAPVSINITPGRPPQVTIRGGDIQEWKDRVAEFNADPEIPDLIREFTDQVNVGGAAASLGGTVTSIASAPSQQAQPMVSDMFVFTDTDGNTWEFNRPDAPDLPDRPFKFALKSGVSKASGKPYRGWFDPAGCFPSQGFAKGQEVKPIFDPKRLPAA